MGYDTLTDAALLKWRRDVHTGRATLQWAEAEALIGEVVRLRRGIRALDSALLQMQQQSLFPAAKPPRPTFKLPR